MYVIRTTGSRTFHSKLELSVFDVSEASPRAHLVKHETRVQRQTALGEGVANDVHLRRSERSPVILQPLADHLVADVGAQVRDFHEERRRADRATQRFQDVVFVAGRRHDDVHLRNKEDPVTLTLS